MKNQLNILLTFFCVVLGIMASGPVAAVEPPHPYHVSLAEVNWNPKSQKFEVALCLWPADLEKALAQQTGRPIDLAKEPNVDRLIEAYVAKRFTIHSVVQSVDQTKASPVDLPSGDSESNEGAAVTKVGNDSPGSSRIQTAEIAPIATLRTKPSAKPAKIKWFGHEADAKQAWLYFEVAADAKANWKVENRVFFELNDDQLNHVQWNGTGKTETLVCDSDNPEISLPKK